MARIQGGIPVSLKGETIAYIGVSGGTPEQDLEIAIAGSTFV
ncbi:heme-binding protein [Chryseobacterium wanjuense]